MRRPVSRVAMLYGIIAVAMICAPLSAAVFAQRAAQTVVITTLVGTSAGMLVAGLLLRRPRGYISSWALGAGGLLGALVAEALAIRATRGIDPDFHAVQVWLIATFDAAGFLLGTIALRRLFPARQRPLALAGLFLILISVAPGPALLFKPSPEATNVVDESLAPLFAYWAASLLLVAPLLALCTLSGEWFERWFKTASARFLALSNRRFTWTLVVGSLGIAVAFAFYCFNARPTTADEIAQLFHARILLAGHIGLPPDPNAEFFAIDNLIDHPRWMSQFPIGGPAFLALGVALRAPWLVNPVLTALTVWNVYRFARRAYGEGQARVAALVFVASPMLLIMGASHMNHTPTTWLVTAALAALPVWIQGESPARLRRAAAVIGVAIGVAASVRPLDALIVAVVFAAIMLTLALREPRRRASILVGAAVGAVPVAILLFANWKTTGHPLRFGYEALWGSGHALGLHDDPTGIPHTPWRALLLGVKYAAQLNWVASGWPVPVLLVVGAGFVVGRGTSRWDMLLSVLILAQLGAYAFYWHDGQFVGPRYLFTALPAVLILAARAPFLLAPDAKPGGTWWRIAVALVPACIAVTWLRDMAPFGGRGLATEFRTARRWLKLPPPSPQLLAKMPRALVFVPEGAATRVSRRLWALKVTRGETVRLMRVLDPCKLLQAIRTEEQRGPADTAGRVTRIELNSAASAGCQRELGQSGQLTPAAYGPLLLENRIDALGRVDGPVIYVLDLGERNEVLRARFGDRLWYRYQTGDSPDSLPVLAPYDPAR